jgi:hypothetical protein
MEKQVEVKEEHTFEEVKAVLKRTDKANPAPEDLTVLHEIFDKVPAMYRHSGNPQQAIFNEILGKIMGNSAFYREAAKRYVAEMKTELGYESSTFVEKMLIDEIVMRWLRLQAMENNHKNTTYGTHTLEEGMYVDKRLHLAQKRYLRAIETLAKVRRLIARTQADGARMYKDLVGAGDGREDKKDT